MGSFSAYILGANQYNIEKIMEPFHLSDDPKNPLTVNDELFGWINPRGKFHYYRLGWSDDEKRYGCFYLKRNPSLVPDEIETYQNLYSFVILTEGYGIEKWEIYKWVNLFFNDREEFKKIIQLERSVVREHIWFLLKYFYCGFLMDIPKELWESYWSDFDLVERADIVQKKNIVKERVIVPCEYFWDGNWIVIDMFENKEEAVKRFWEDWESLGEHDYITAVTCYI